MRSTRIALRAQRSLRAAAPVRQQIRFASESAGSSSGGGTTALTGGLIGGGSALAIAYGWYHFSGVKTAVQTAHSASATAKQALDSFKIKFSEQTPDTDDALKTLKDTAYKYATFIPGGRGYVDSAFKDVESIRQKHGGEVDQIVHDVYNELRDVSKKELSMATASDAIQVLNKHLQRIFSLASDAAEDILSNHPQLKEKVGGSADQLRQLGERLGPQAKQEVDETWQQVSEIMKSGLQVDTIEKVRKLVQEKTEKLKEMGERAFDEQIKPMLNDNPKVKQMVEDNMQTLRQGNIAQIVSTVQSAVKSGDTGDLEKYIQKAKQSSSGHLSDWLNMIPNGGEILPQMQKLQEIATQKGGQVEHLVKEAIDEIKGILQEKTKKAEELAESGKQEVKNQ